MAFFSEPSIFPLIQIGTNLVGIDQLTALRGGVALLDFCPDLPAVLGQPSFLFVKQGNGALNEFLHALVGPSLNVLLDHFLQLGAQMNLHDHGLPHFS